MPSSPQDKQTPTAPRGSSPKLWASLTWDNLDGWAGSPVRVARTNVISARVG